MLFGGAVKLNAAYRVPASPDRVFAAVTDPDVLCRCLEGCESLTRKEDGAYEARLRVGLGHIKGTYSGIARMTDVQPPQSYTLKVEGRGAGGFVNGAARMHLTGEGDSATTVTCNADVTVGGVIAAVGSRLIEVAAKRMIDRFFDSLSRELARL